MISPLLIWSTYQKELVDCLRGDETLNSNCLVDKKILKILTVVSALYLVTCGCNPGKLTVALFTFSLFISHINLNNYLNQDSSFFMYCSRITFFFCLSPTIGINLSSKMRLSIKK